MKKKENEKLNLFLLLKTITPKIIRISPVYFWIAVAISIIHGLFWGIDILVRQVFLTQQQILWEKLRNFAVYFLLLPRWLLPPS